MGVITLYKRSAEESVCAILLGTMNNLLPQTQDLIKSMKKSQDMIVMSYDALVSLLATMEEEMDEGSKKARSEAEKDIKMGNLTCFDEVLKSS